MRLTYLLVCFLFALSATGQNPKTEKDSTKTVNDSINKIEFSRSLMNGYLLIKYFDFDLRYLLKYNQYEGLRTGIGGVTNHKFSERYKIQ